MTPDSMDAPAPGPVSACLRNGCRYTKKEDRRHPDGLRIKNMSSTIPAHVYEVRPRMKIDSDLGHSICDDAGFQKLVSQPESATDFK
jgi:hypothetical protein